MKNNRFIPKLFITLISLAMVAGCSNTAPNNNSNSNVNDSLNGHEHTFASTWTYDENVHWHEATCGHDVKGGVAAHVFSSTHTKATTETEGYTTYTCNTCGYSYKETEKQNIAMTDRIKTYNLISYNVNDYSPLHYSFNLKDCAYFIYKIGVINHLPVSSNVMPQGYNPADGKKTWSFERTTTTQTALENEISYISNAAIKTDEYDDYDSVISGFSSGWGFNASLGLDGIGGGYNETEGTNYAFLLKKVTSRSSSYQKSVSQLLKYSETESLKESIQYEFTPEYTKAGYYRYVLFANVEMYAIEIYDRNTKSLKHAFQYPLVISQMYDLDYSPDGNFNYNEAATLDFNKETTEYVEPTENLEEQVDNYCIANDMVEHCDDANKYVYLIVPTKKLRVDLSSIKRGSDLSESNIDLFDNGLFTFTPSYHYYEIDTIEIIGTYYTRDSYSRLMTELVNGVSFNFVDYWGERDIDVILRNVGVSSISGYDCFDFTNVNGNVTIYVYGVNAIKANGSSKSALKGNDINIISNDSDSKLIAEGGNASPNTTSGSNGYNGGAAIICNNLEVNNLDKLEVYGGDGGKGTVGTTAGNGGNGGNAIECLDDCFIKCNSLLLVPGKGGDGANGKNGTNGYNGTSGKDDSKESGTAGSDGTSGKNGGNGGSTGIGLKAANATLNCVNAKATIYQNGAGGSGGDGGNGGRGGDAGSTMDWFGSPTGNGKGGNGGKGGKGGNGGSTGFTGRALSVSGNVEYINNELTIELVSRELLSGKAGNGGNGGNGGNTGQTKTWGRNPNDTGVGGNGGSTGTTGNVIVLKEYKDLLEFSSFVSKNTAIIGVAGANGTYVTGRGNGSDPSIFQRGTWTVYNGSNLGVGIISYI